MQKSQRGGASSRGRGGMSRGGGASSSMSGGGSLPASRKAQGGGAGGSGAASDSGDLTEDDDEEDEEDMEEEEEEEDEGDEDDEGQPDSIDVEFSFCDPRPIDFKSVRRLLERYVVGEEGFPLASMVEDVIAQRVVGTMVKIPGDELNDAYAFATLLPMVQHAHKDWAIALRAYMLRKAARDEGALAALTAAWDSPATLGLLLNERIFNMPPELAPAIHDSLLQDIAWAKVHAPGDSKVAFMDIAQVLAIAPCWLEAAGSSSSAAASSGGGSSGAGSLGGAVPPGFVSHYLRFEEALWASEASASLAFAVAAPAEAQTGGGGGGGSSGEAGMGEAPEASSGSRPKARKAHKRKAGGGEGQEEEEGEGEAAAATVALHAPQVRHVLLFPMAALPRVTSAMAGQVEAAKEAQKKAEGGTKKSRQ